MKLKRNRKMRSGAIYVLAVTMVLILSLLGIGLLRLGQSARLQAIKDVLQMSARSAADAGIEHAVRYMIDDWNGVTDQSGWVNDWNVTGDTAPKYFFPANLEGTVTLPNTYGNARFRYDIYRGLRSEGYRITSTGTAGGVTRTVHAAVVLKSAFFGIGAKDKISISPNMELGVIPVDGNFIVQTNSTDENAVTLKPSLLIPGDVVIGPGGDTDISINYRPNKVDIEGESRASEDYIDFPSISRPTYSTIIDSLPIPDSVNEPNVAEISNASVQINGGLTLDDAIHTLKIVGNVEIFVNGDTYLSPETQIVVAEGATLTLYLGGNLMMMPGSNITYGTVPPATDSQIVDAAKAISIKGTVGPLPDEIPDCTEIRFQPNDDFYGSIYAPDAAIELWPGGDFYGAVVGGNSLELKPGGTFIFVSELYDFPDIEIMYMGVKHGSWWEE
jgi:hypothetical protein